ncbi:MAG: 16S rRNA (adenine(1518)-N(6)/adenine(1519)-N(6))-dimethyltransferase RsmA [Deltaproteobacteria bacterium]|nr:16S rRNA (adenine(1518)-N(6)/adenine(1519)-N(6))-dimethyltransferase RsmA [Deltaproteobacteria bacterium]
MGFAPSKARGQNFLVHEHVIDAILRLVQPGEQDRILEVGPGLGFVTRRLIGAERRVWAVEVDSRLVQWLGDGPLGSHAGFQLVHDDVLQTDFDGFLPDGKIKVVANLPYSVAAPVLLRLFEEGRRFSLLVVMLQKEVARRLTAAPGTPSYGALSVWSRLYGRVTERVPVAPEAFTPKPKVDSTLLRIELLDPPALPPAEIPGLRAVVRAGFGQRRKMLGNALAGLFGSTAEAVFETAAVDPRRRAETLNLDEFGRLARAFRDAREAVR